MKKIAFKKWISFHTILIFMFQQISPVFAMDYIGVEEDIRAKLQNRPAATVEKSLSDDKITNLPRFALAVEQEGEGLHDLANYNYHLSLGEETDKDFRSSSNEKTTSPAFTADYPEVKEEISAKLRAEKTTSPSSEQKLTAKEKENILYHLRQTLPSSTSLKGDFESSLADLAPPLLNTIHANLKADLISCLRNVVEKELRPCIEKKIIKLRYGDYIPSPILPQEDKCRRYKTGVTPLLMPAAMVVFSVMTLYCYLGPQVEQERAEKKLKGEKFRSKFKSLATELTNAKFDIHGGNLFGEKGPLKKINPDINISKIKGKANALRYLSFLIDKNKSNDSEEIWDHVFQDFTKELFQYVSQPAEELHETATKLLKKRETNLGVLVQEVQKKSPHIKAEFITTVAMNLDESNLYKNINVTGSPLSKKKLDRIIACMDLCTHIYTDDLTRNFVGKRVYVDSIEGQWNGIVQNKKGITKCYDKLSALSAEYDKLIQQNPLFIREGAKNIPSEQVLATSRASQIPWFQENFTACIKETNLFLQTINRKPIEHKEIETIQLAINELGQIQKNIDSEYFFHFTQTPSNNNHLFLELDGQAHWLTNKAIIAASFLHKTQLSVNENITILDVGFRNLEDLQGILIGATKKIKHNPAAWFEEWGEVDYIAYLESDPTPTEKDKLFIVYSGSNSAKDWVTNFTIGHTDFCDFSAHTGIGKLFTKSIPYGHSLLSDRIRNFYNYHRKPKKLDIITTGHSLGGALASLAAYFYKTKQRDIFQKITGLDKGDIRVKTFLFGSPAIVDKQSKKIMEKGLGKNNIFRVWTFEDPVVNLTNDAPLQRGLHIGMSYPLYNIEKLPFDDLPFVDSLFSQYWAHHGTNRYRGYLHALGRDTLSKHHKKFTALLNNYVTNSQSFEATQNEQQDK